MEDDEMETVTTEVVCMDGLGPHCGSRTSRNPRHVSCVDCLREMLTQVVHVRPGSRCETMQPLDNPWAR